MKNFLVGAGKRDHVAALNQYHVVGLGLARILFGVRLHLLPPGCIFNVDAREATIGPAHDRY